MQNETQNQNIDSQEAKVEEAAVQTEAPQEPNIGANTDPYRGPEVEEPADITDPKVTMSLDDLVGSDPKVTMNPEDLFGPETTEEPGDVIDIEDISADPLGLGGDGLPDDIIIDNWGSTDWDEIGSRTPEYVPELFEDKPVPTDQVDLLASEAAATPFPEVVSMPTDQEEALPFEPGTGTDPGVIPDHVPDTGVQDPNPTRPDLQQSHTLGTEEGVGDAVGDVPGSAQSPGYESEYASAILGSGGTPNDGGEHVPHPDDTSIREVPDITHPGGPQPKVIVDPDSEPVSIPSDGGEHVPHPDDWEDEPTQPNHTPHPDDTSIREVPDITHPGGPQPKVIVDPDSEPTVTDAEPLSLPDDDPIWEEAVEVLEDAGQAAQDGITDAAYAIGENVGDAVDTYFDAVDDINEAIYDGVEDAYDAVGEAVGDAYDAVGEAVGDAYDTVGDAVGDAAEAVGETFEDAADAVWEAAEDAYDAVGEAVGDAADAIGEVVEDAADAVWEAAEDAASAVGAEAVAVAGAVGAEVVAVGDAVGTGVGLAAGAVWEAGEDAYDAVEEAVGDAADAVGE